MFKEPDGTLLPGGARDFEALSQVEKNILKKLWRLEGASGNSSGRKVGLVVSPEAPGYPNFTLGRDRLAARGFVQVGEIKGVVVLRPAGRVFCEANQAEIELYQPRQMKE